MVYWVNLEISKKNFIQPQLHFHPVKQWLSHFLKVLQISHQTIQHQKGDMILASRWVYTKHHIHMQFPYDALEMAQSKPLLQMRSSAAKDITSGGNLAFHSWLSSTEREFTTSENIVQRSWGARKIAWHCYGQIKWLTKASRSIPLIRRGRDLCWLLQTSLTVSAKELLI